MMANRSDRHSLKPATCRAFEAIRSIRRECADFHRGLGPQSVVPRRQAVYATATGFLLTAGFRCRALEGRGPYGTRHSSPDEGVFAEKAGNPDATSGTSEVIEGGGNG